MDSSEIYSVNNFVRINWDRYRDRCDFKALLKLVKCCVEIPGYNRPGAILLLSSDWRFLISACMYLWVNGQCIKCYSSNMSIVYTT